MSDSFLQTDDSVIDIDLLTGVWRHEYATAAVPPSEDDALAQLQSGGVLQVVFPLVAELEADYATAGEAISLALEQARSWRKEPLFHNPLWWKVRPHGQTYRRFLVVGGNFVEITQQYADNLDTDGLRRGNLVLWLHIAPPENSIPRYFGELSAGVGIGGSKSMVGSPTYPPAVGDGADITTLGGILQVTAEGTRPGRISLLEVVNQNVTLGNALNHIWVGIKPTSRTVAEDPTTFNPNLMTLTADPATPFTDTSGGAGENTYEQFVVTNNSDAFGECFYAAFPGAGVTVAHFVGNYLVLLRYKVTAVTGSGTKPVRFRIGYGVGNGTFIYSEPVYIAAPAVMTTWGILAVGFAKFPTAGARYDGFTLAGARIKLQANALDSGDTVTVQFNRFVIMPRPYVYISSTSLYNTRRLLYKTHADDKQEAVIFTSATGLPSVPTVPYKEVTAELSPDFYIPAHGGTLTILGARSLSEQDETDVVDIGAVIYDRYMSWKA